jgi:small-conductance mechanosensitive channel
MRNGLSLLAVLGITLLAPILPLHAQTELSNPQPLTTNTGVDVDVPVATVTLDRRTLFAVRGSSSIPAAERAAAISGRILDFARNDTLSIDSIRTADTPNGTEILAGDTRLMTVVPADGAMELLQHQALAKYHAAKISEAVTAYRQERTPQQLLQGTLIALASTAVLAAIWWLLFIAYRWAEGRLTRRVQAKIEALPLATIDDGRIAIMQRLQSALNAFRWIVRLILLLFWLELVLAQFPWTRWISDDIVNFILDPLAWIAMGFIDYLPKLMFLVVLFYVTRFGLRILKLYFVAIEHRRTTLTAFEPEWAMPSYKIVRTAILALALIMAYPYLPGSGTDALKGISVFAGLLLSLGASSSVSSIIAGYLNTFGRVYKTGDVIQIGEIRGTVTQIRLMTTRLRTIRNEEVVIPNSVIAGSSLTNYSALARERGLMLQTEVGIGYEVPWRQVEAMLLDAAARTHALLAEPPAFVIQRQLGDFAVVYQLNVYTDNPMGMFRTYSALHQNILDVFNEHNVQIMTPAYEGDPDTPKVVPKELWFAQPAKPPQKAPDSGAA